MPARIDIGTVAPAAYKAMAGLDAFVRHSALPKTLLDLIRLRASQINGCAYCVDSHSTDLKTAGESDARISAVAAWQEGPFFSEQERAALALTESMTRLSEGGDRVSDDVWAQAVKHFDETDLAALITAIATINAWNRFGVAARLVPESYQA